MSVATSVDMDLSRLLIEGAIAEHSGIATAVRGKLKRLFCLDKGVLVFAASNLIEEQIPETLVRERLISTSDLSAARTASEQMGVKLTRLLVDEKVIDGAALTAVLERHLRELLFSTLDWPDGEASLARGNPDLGDEVTANLPCAALLLEYSGRHPSSLQEVQRRVGPTASYLLLAEDRVPSLDPAESSPAMQHAIEQCAEQNTVAELLRTSPDPEEATWRALYGLLLVGILTRPADADAPGLKREEVLTRIENAELSDHYTLLRVNSGSTAQHVLEAYYGVARNYHPDRFRTGPLQDLRERMEGYFARVTEAYNTLYDSERREAYDRELAEQEQAETVHDTTDLAKQNVSRARILISRGRFADAVPWLKNAIQQDERNAEYRVLLGQVMARNPRLRKEAEQHLIEANRIDPANIDGYLALGDLYMKQSDRANAAKMFREVLRWDPGHLEAETRLRKVGG